MQKFFPTNVDGFADGLIFLTAAIVGAAVQIFDGKGE